MRKRLAWFLLDLAMCLLWPEADDAVIKLNTFGGKTWIELLPDGSLPYDYIMYTDTNETADDAQ